MCQLDGPVWLNFFANVKAEKIIYSACAAHTKAISLSSFLTVTIHD